MSLPFISVETTDGLFVSGEPIELVKTHNGYSCTLHFANHVLPVKDIVSINDGIETYKCTSMEATYDYLMEKFFHIARMSRPKLDKVGLSLDELEIEYIKSVLAECNDNQREACKILGISRSTLWRRLGKTDD